MTRPSPPLARPAPASPRDPVRRWAAAVAISVPAVFVVCLIAQAVIANSTDAPVNLVGPAFLYAIVGAAAACALLAVGVAPRPRSRGYVATAAVMGAVAGLAPISLVVYLRLSVHACVVMNILGLPWPEPGREIAHVASGLIVLGSTVFLIVAVTRPSLKRAGVAMWIWSAAIAFPTMLLYFLVVYGDPAAGCLPV